MPADCISPTMNLEKLLEGMVEAPPVPVCGINDDSRRLLPGDVFIATQGASRHGLEFASAAIAAGVSAVVWDTDTGDATLASGAVPFIGVAGLAARVGDIANRWFGEPSRDLGVVGVTGTNGKTTVAWLSAQSLKRLGRDCGYVGTLGYGLDTLDVDLGLTTPPCIDLQAKLAGFRDQGAKHAA
ncbi:MAG: Mur ligase family protein, partial [Pseudomonadota bacterium]